MEIFLFILVAGFLAHVIGASVHEGIFVGALVRFMGLLSPAKALRTLCGERTCFMCQLCPLPSLPRWCIGELEKQASKLERLWYD